MKLPKESSLIRGLRSYAALKRRGKVTAARELRDSMVDAALPRVAAFAPRWLAKDAQDVLPISVHQYLLLNLVGPEFRRAVVSSTADRAAPILLPLPMEWRIHLRKQKCKISRFSIFLWTHYVFKAHWQGLKRAIKHLLRAILHSADSVDRLSRSAFFLGLTESNLPGADLSERYNICSWYAQWRQRNPHIVEIRHDVFSARSLRQAQDLPCRYSRLFCGPVGWQAAVRYAIWLLAAEGASIFAALLGRWWMLLLFGELADAKVASLLPANHLAAEYWYPFSGSIYRPLWTYVAENRGARVISFFYTTYEQPMLHGKVVRQRIEMELATWSEYAVWDQPHSDLLRQEIAQPHRSTIAGPIWFTDSGSRSPLAGPDSVAVFDITMHRPAFHLGLSPVAEYFNQVNSLSLIFIRDIYAALHRFGIHTLLKQKREIGNRAIKQEKRALETMAKQEDFHLIDPSISAISLIRDTRFSISMPFTSTPLYATAVNKPAAYYDPIGWIDSKDPAAHSIPILRGPSELRLWIEACGKDAMH